jgi:hypothetical protein
MLYMRGYEEIWQARSDGSRRSVIIRAREHDIGHDHWMPDKPAISPDGRMITFDADEPSALEVDVDHRVPLVLGQLVGEAVGLRRRTSCRLAPWWTSSRMT